jgi:sugar lactone lactonase YvrE
MRLSSVAAGACSLALAAALLAAPAHAGGPHTRGPDVLADGLVGPLSLAVGKGGSVIVTQSFAGTVTRIDRHGGQTALYQLPDPENGAIAGAATRRGASYHLELSAGENGPVGQVIRLDRDGERHALGDDLLAYEQENNPDGEQTYGFHGLDQECAAEVAAFETTVSGPEGPLLLDEYPGIVESNPYQLTVHRGAAYVADAAANAILRVDLETGEISTVAVLPGTPITFTEETKAHFEAVLGGATMPDCVVGESFTPEPVPTDVEVGEDGRLYVSTLQGLAGEAFPLSTVYRVNPRSGSVKAVADRGMQGATGLAIAPDGRILVAELFGGEVSVVTPGRSTARTLFEVESPGDVEIDGRTVYATAGVLGEGGAPGDGSVVTYRYRTGR